MRRLGIVAVLAALIAGAAVLAIGHAAARRHAGMRDVTRLSQSLGEAQLLERRVVDLETGLRGYLPTGDPALLAPWYSARSALPGDFAELGRMIAGERSQPGRLAALRRGVSGYETGYAAPLIAAAPVTGRGLDAEARRGKVLFDALRGDFAGFDAGQQARLAAAEARVGDAQQTLTATVIGAVVTLAAVLLGLVLYIGRVVVIPVRRVIAACAELAAGERAGEVRASGAPELRALAEAFNAMALRLEERQAALGRAREQAEDAGQLRRQLLANLPDTLVALYDRELRCLLLDGALVREAGVDPTEYLGRPIQETLPAEHYRPLEPLFRRALAGGSGSTEWTSALSGVTYEVEIEPYRLCDGTITGALAIARDTAERRERERRLLDRERMLAESQAVAHIGSWEADVRTDRVVWSDELCRIFGRAPGFSPTTAEFIATIHPGDRELVVESVRATLAGESEYRIVRPDGEVRHVHTSRFARLDEHGVVTHRYGTTQDITDRVRRERELRHLASIVEQSAEAITSADAGGRITGWNRGAEALYGYTSAEALGRPISMLIAPNRDGEDRALLERVLAGETLEQFSTQRRHKDGRLIDVSLTVSPVRDAQGRAVGTSVVTRDVTERRRAERERERALADLNEAQRIAQIGSWTWEVESDTAQWTHQMYRIFGREPELGPVSRDEFFAYLHPDDRRRVIDDYATTFGGGPGFEIDFRILAGDGVERVLHAHGRLERPGHYVGTVQDVTGLRLLERDARASERRFRSTLAHAPIGMAIVAPDGRWLVVNRALCEITGYSEAELLARTFQDITHPDDLGDDLEHCRQLLAGEIQTYRTEKRYFRKSGDCILVQLSVAVMRDEHGEPVQFISQMQDITAERAAGDALAETQRQLQAIMENLAGSGVTVYDRDQRLRLCEGPLFAHLDRAGLLGRPLAEFAETETVELLAALIERALEGTGSTAVLDADRDGRTLAIHVAPYRLSGGSIDGALVHWHDITPVRVAERARDEALERFRIAFDRAPIGMAIIGLDGRFQRVNAALCAMSGYAAEHLLEHDALSVVHADDLEEVRHELALLVAGAGTMTLEHRIERATGDSAWVQAQVTLIRGEDGEPVHLLAQIQDISARREYEQRLRHLADHDSLTGLLNRRGFEAVLESHIALSQRYGAAGALLVLDLDGFKRVNDELGHAAGDQLLLACADTLTGRLRETDLIGRLGGDEFAVVLPFEGAAEAEVVARALIEAIGERTTAQADACARAVTVSIGVAAFADSELSADQILIGADLAMYAAKEAGRGRYALHTAAGPVVRREAELA